MRLHQKLPACLALAWVPLVAADTLKLRSSQNLSYTEVAVGHVRETLSNQPLNWAESQIELLHKFGDRRLLIARVTGSERFGLYDTTASLAGYYPLGERTMLFAELSASDTHRVLPRDGLHLQLAHTLGRGWGVSGGLKRLRYNNTIVEGADLTLEYYFSNFRISLTALPSHSSTAGGASSYRLQLGHYYGDENNVQLVVASGDEVDQLVAAGTIVKTPVRSTVIFGRHWFARDWAFTYNIGRTHQGATRRDAAGVGLRYRF